MASLPMPQWPERVLSFAKTAPASGPATAATLSALEWSVVAMAETDGTSSLREPSRFVSALGSLFGVRRPNRLANHRLESLRRLAVHAWRYTWNVPDSELRAFLAAGFTLDQYELVQASIARARNSRAAQRRRFSR